MDYPIVFFDGLCNLCNRAVQFIITHDRAGKFRFASLQSAFAKEKLASYGIDNEQQQSIVLLDGIRVYEQSAAALHIARQLRQPWPLLYGFIFIPRFIRDGVYRYIARNRYRWFGRRMSCWVPDPALKARFLDGMAKK